MKWPNSQRNTQLVKLNHEERENLDRVITRKGFESVPKNLPAKKSPAPDGFTGEFYQIYKEQLTSVFLELF